MKKADGDWRCEIFIFRTCEQNAGLENPEQISFGPTITNPDEVPDRVQRAQRAILNPNTDSSRYLHDNLDDDEQNELSFSQDYISIQISGPGLVDLSFVDLPGAHYVLRGKWRLTPCMSRSDSQRRTRREPRRYRPRQKPNNQIHREAILPHSSHRIL